MEKTPQGKIGKLISERPDIIDVLESYNYQHPDQIDVKYKEKPVNFIILDDLMGSSAFNKKAQNKLGNRPGGSCGLTYVPGHGIPFARAIDYGK